MHSFLFFYFKFDQLRTNVDFMAVFCLLFNRWYFYLFIFNINNVNVLTRQLSFFHLFKDKNIQ